jgi:hypothetical protein
VEEKVGIGCLLSVPSAFPVCTPGRLGNEFEMLALPGYTKEYGIYCTIEPFSVV